MATNQSAYSSTPASAIVPIRVFQTTIDNSKYINSDIEGNNNFRPWTSGKTERASAAATILLFQGSNLSDTNYQNVPIADLGNISGFPDQYLGVFKNFSLTRYGESRQEAYNIQRTFGKDWVAFFFGEQPRTYRFEGHFLDYIEYPHYQQFMIAYDEYIRGTKCIENNMTMYISYDGKLIRGLILAMNTSKASAPGIPAGVVQFDFTLLVMGDQWIRSSIGIYSNVDILKTLTPFIPDKTSSPQQ